MLKLKKYFNKNKKNTRINLKKKMKREKGEY